MDALIDWLDTPHGILLVHSVIGLLNAVTLVILSRQRAAHNQLSERLDLWTNTLMRQIHGGHEHV